MNKLKYYCQYNNKFKYKIKDILKSNKQFIKIFINKTVSEYYINIRNIIYSKSNSQTNLLILKLFWIYLSKYIRTTTYLNRILPNINKEYTKKNCSYD